MSELMCDRCGREYFVVWFAPDDVWNAVMRYGDRASRDAYEFCCPTCFLQLADRVFPDARWKVAPA